MWDSESQICGRVREPLWVEFDGESGMAWRADSGVATNQRPEAERIGGREKWVSYNIQKEKWSLNELIAQCVQEEETHKQNKDESAHLASSSGAKATKKRKKNDKGTANNGESSKNVHKKHDTGPTYFFCRKYGHVKKDCPKFAD
ncbi:Retrovirus-related Pol polyprotein from transposon TNT 1-94 [Senna tora]|uniref:Retrovirus-related Pol polyprotein from transposon TNT 1-94 n=1 Tax=Senna tora TaxID=362788 RepID=A0A834WMR2_9FABA|nr:Retrovirus-related Pol polyprotein from transposon TNT 1-94 [Senna tora]